MMQTSTKKLVIDKAQAWPFWLLIFYYAMIYLRPYDNYLSFLSPLKIPGIMALLLFFVFLKFPKSYLSDSAIKWLFALLILMAAHIPFAVNNFHAFKTTELFTIIIFTTVFPTVYLLNTKDRIEIFFKYWVWIQTGVALITISRGGVGPGSYLEDENDVALVINMAIPFAFYFYCLRSNTKLQKTVYLACLLIMISAIVATGSRGGLLGLVAAMVGIWWFSRHRVKNLLIALFAILVFGSLLLKFLPESYIAEMSTITDTEDSTRNERLDSWEIGWIMFKHSPVFGVGPNNYPWNVGFYESLASHWIEGYSKSLSGRAAHSLFFTLLPELGAVGVIIFLVLSTKMIKRSFKAIKYYKTDDESFFYYLNMAIMVSLFSYLVTGIFLSVFYYPFFWILMGFSIAVYRVDKVHLEDTNPKKSALINRRGRNR